MGVHYFLLISTSTRRTRGRRANRAALRASSLRARAGQTPHADQLVGEGLENLEFLAAAAQAVPEQGVRLVLDGA